MNTIHFDSDTVHGAPNPAGLGTLHITLPDEKLLDYVQALVTLGYAPEVSITEG